jgi:hypothetical protein
MNVIDQLRRMGNESHKMIEAFENYADSDFDPRDVLQAFMDSSKVVDVSEGEGAIEENDGEEDG